MSYCETPIVLTDFPKGKSPRKTKLEKYSYSKEEELQREVANHYKEVLGKDVIPVGRPASISLPSMRGKTIPDDFALDLTNKEKPKLLLIEYERSIHEVYDHISTQILKFEDAVRNNKQNVFETLRKKFEDPDIQLKLYDAIFNQPVEKLVIIDNVEKKVEEIANRFDIGLMEFSTYVEDKEKGLNSPHVHVFEPYYEGKARGKREEREKRPKHERDWDSRYDWAKEKARNLFEKVKVKVEEKFPVVEHEPTNRWYYFYSSSTKNARNLFLVILLRESFLRARIPAHPEKFEDERNKTKSMKGWFYYSTKDRPEIEERDLEIRTFEDIEYLIELLEHSYDFTRGEL